MVHRAQLDGAPVHNLVHGVRCTMYGCTGAHYYLPNDFNILSGVVAMCACHLFLKKAHVLNCEIIMNTVSIDNLYKNKYECEV